MSHEHGPTNRQVFSSVVDELCGSALSSVAKGPARRLVMPSRDIVLSCVAGLREVLFPGFFGETDLHTQSLHYYVGATLDRVFRELEEQIARAYAIADQYEPTLHENRKSRAEQTCQTLLARLPKLRELVASDVHAAFEGDPALKIIEEAVFCYPGIYATTEQRIAHELHLLGVPLIPRIITEHAHSITGIDIHPGATIGRSFFIDHGTGVVIGETCRIGDRVRLYQGVTLGAKSFPLDENGAPIKGIDRHPIVEDDVVIYAGATILGRITIGRGSTVGGNVWITRSVAPASRVSQSEPREERYQDGAGI